MSKDMEQAVLECCEKNCEIISPEVVNFARDLVKTIIVTSENKIDDMFLGIIDKAFDVLDTFLAKQIDKIDGQEG